MANPLNPARKKHKFVKAWMHEHVNDPYVQEAQRRGYRSRAAFKLLEPDARDKLLRPGSGSVRTPEPPRVIVRAGGEQQVGSDLDELRRHRALLRGRDGRQVGDEAGLGNAKYGGRKSAGGDDDAGLDCLSHLALPVKGGGRLLL